MSNRSFDLVDYKLAEAQFFLDRFAEAGADFFKAQCYFSAFVAAARSVTFSLQAVLASAPGFGEWYTTHQRRLRDDEVARFFHEARTLGQHVGVSPVRGGSGGPGMPWTYHFTPCPDFPAVPRADVLSCCQHLMRLISEVLFDCYTEFGELIDPERYYSQEAFAKRGLNIEDAEFEIFGVRGWTDVPGISMGYKSAQENYRWQMIRDSMPGCQIDDVFELYLGKTRPRPARVDPPPPESIVLPTGWTRVDGWLLPPGYDSVDAYLTAREAGIAPIN